MRTAARVQAGFGIVSAVFLLVMMAVLAASITFMSSTQRGATTIDILGSRAYQAARAGVEWGAFRTLQGVPCAGSTNVTFPAGSSLSAFTATVTCVATTTNEGGSTITLYSIVSNACNIPTGGGACPNAASNNAIYVERQLSAVVGG